MTEWDEHRCSPTLLAASGHESMCRERRGAMTRPSSSTLEHSGQPAVACGGRCDRDRGVRREVLEPMEAAGPDMQLGCSAACPDPRGVLADRAVAGEWAHAGDIESGAAVPGRRRGIPADPTNQRHAPTAGNIPTPHRREKADQGAPRGRRIVRAARGNGGKGRCRAAHPPPVDYRRTGGAMT